MQRCFSQPFIMTFANITMFSLEMLIVRSVVLIVCFTRQAIVQMSVEFAQHTEHTRLDKKAREKSTSTQTLNAEDQRLTDPDAVTMTTSQQHTQVRSQHMKDVDGADRTGFQNTFRFLLYISKECVSHTHTHTHEK